MKESFIFYRSFFESLKDLNNDDKSLIYDAIGNFALNQKEDKLSGIPKAIFTLIKPQIEANNKRYSNGKRGGRPAQNHNQSETKAKPNHNQTITKAKPNVNVNVNDNVNVNVNVNEKTYVNGVVDEWNIFAEKNNLAKLLKISNKRKSGINARSKEKQFNLTEILKKVIESDFLLGKGKRYWKVDFDFIFCSTNNYLKILEGKYDRKEGSLKDAWDKVKDI